ncbi:hypothetical protein J437_LFUL004176 [Ladona fulva]|uniref:Regulatory protein zeste n=1 Tax=Ladona fulva TaxID=123851 RepID=A0A8K0K079_LADFU|nr:hypothetical protein J437_LFUL004176 [Ladona fulva]
MVDEGLGTLKRISGEQREAMLSSMEANPDMARNRISGPNALVAKATKWRELASILNAASTGVSVTLEKWMKSWQDWKSDIQAKVSRLRHHAAGTGGQPSMTTSLTALEERLLKFLGETAVSGIFGKIDPLEIVTVCTDGTIEFTITEEESSLLSSPSTYSSASSETPTKRRKLSVAHDELDVKFLETNDRTAAAIEKMSEYNEEDDQCQ